MKYAEKMIIMVVIRMIVMVPAVMTEKYPMQENNIQQDKITFNKAIKTNIANTFIVLIDKYFASDKLLHKFLTST